MTMDLDTALADREGVATVNVVATEVNSDSAMVLGKAGNVAA